MNINSPTIWLLALIGYIWGIRAAAAAGAVAAAAVGVKEEGRFSFSRLADYPRLRQNFEIDTSDQLFNLRGYKGRLKSSWVNNVFFIF